MFDDKCRGLWSVLAGFIWSGKEKPMDLDRNNKSKSFVIYCIKISSLKFFINTYYLQHGKIPQLKAGGIKCDIYSWNINFKKNKEIIVCPKP